MKNKNLSARELTVFQHRANGLLAKEIADLLGINVETVNDHCTSIIRKMGALNMVNAVYIGTKKRII